MSSRSKLVVVVPACLLLLAAVPVTESAQVSISDWTWPPFIIIPLLFILGLYFVGLTKMYRGRARSSISRWRIASFMAGWLSLLIALDSPIHELGEQLFWVHMTQHEIMMLISAPLIVLGRPLIVFTWAMPERWRQPLGRVSKWRFTRGLWNVATLPLVAWILHALALWLWHAPILFDATLSSDFIHALQHISFFGTALLFWWALVYGHRGRLGYGGSLLYVFTTAVHSSVLGALLTFSSRAWYSPYFSTAPAWHLTALEDQQVGGLIMWIPAGTLLVLVSLGLLVKWIAESDRRWKYTQASAVVGARRSFPDGVADVL
jgi:cytochrome c oxidase assembly factor CtaG